MIFTLHLTSDFALQLYKRRYFHKSHRFWIAQYDTYSRNVQWLSNPLSKLFLETNIPVFLQSVWFLDVCLTQVMQIHPQNREDSDIVNGMTVDGLVT